MNTYDYEDWLFRIDSNLKDFRNLKEQHVLFNSRNGGNPIAVRTEIDRINSQSTKNHHMKCSEISPTY